MKALFRVLVVASIAAASVALLIPFDHSYPISVELDQPPPLWLVAALLGIVAIPLLLVSALGLLAFRRWSRSLSMLASFLLVISTVTFLSDFPFGSTASPVAIALLVISAAAWFGALVLSYNKRIAPQFLAER
ncbi:hypothetical protein [Lysobacter sp. M2-1]|uniref:hypothetical protein n=1 Tax=Lysobacter sp. M2-1 TaxID=2916839 RepID=UPI001F572BBD|nr:hypothetical protein [Lysobacter sp. M2-1]